MIRIMAGSMISIGLVLTPAAASAHALAKFTGQIVTTANLFCPKGTLEANGQEVQIMDYTALFSLFGTEYGGDGRTTFALPDFSDLVQPTTGQSLKFCVVTGGTFPSRP